MSHPTPLADRPHALYRFYDHAGTLLYIGITASIPTRFADHRDTKPWWATVTRITVEHHPDRVAVLAAETAAIHTERPLWNIAHNTARRAGPARRAVRDQHHAGGDEWTFTSRSGHTRTVPLWLYWEVAGDLIGDNYAVADIAADELWHEWLTRREPDTNAEHLFGPGAVAIYWFVEGPATFEAAPFQDRRNRFVAEAEHFGHHYTWPVRPDTGERVQWGRLPVIDKVWRTTNLPDLHTFTGGFIQEATGWKPAPFQPYVNAAELAGMSGLYPPESGW